MKEIGGYFGLEQFTGSEYHKGLLALNNGRSALLYLLKARKISKLYIPYFLCDSISNLCDQHGYSYEYYPIDSSFLPVFDFSLSDSEWLYVVNFYGQINNSQVAALKSRYNNIIFDNVHAFFQNPVAGVDTIYSCRKFFGVPDGAYLSTQAVLDETLEQDISKDRMRHILGRYEGCASDYYADFKSNDHSFSTLPLRRMSKLTHNLMSGVNYDSVRATRNANYAYLAASLGGHNKLCLSAPDGPYCYPFYYCNGMELKKALAEEHIYVATLWPNVLTCGAQLEIDYAKNILPLPCDQRYDSGDMRRVIDAILRYLGK